MLGNTYLPVRLSVGDNVKVERNNEHCRNTLVNYSARKSVSALVGMSQILRKEP